VLVAQAQALFNIVSRDELLSRCWPDGAPDVRPTFAELAVKAGGAHAEIASGMYDNKLADVVGNSLGGPKVGLLRRHLVRIQDYIRGQAFDQAVKWIKPACGIASTALGSMSFIPGVGAIKEGIDLIPSGLETVQLLPEKDMDDKPQPNGRTK